MVSRCRLFRVRRPFIARDTLCGSLNGNFVPVLSHGDTRRFNETVTIETATGEQLRLSSAIIALFQAEFTPYNIPYARYGFVVTFFREQGRQRNLKCGDCFLFLFTCIVFKYIIFRKNIQRQRNRNTSFVELATYRSRLNFSI